MALEGDVETFPLRELFAWLAGRSATGVLTLSRGMTIRRFHLQKGHVRLVSSSEQEMLLGHLLIERKLLGPEALEQALAGRGRSRTRLGRLLLRGGLVPPNELHAILTEKVRRLLADAITWSDGRFVYEAEAAVTGPEPGQGRRRSRAGEIVVAVDLGAALKHIEAGDGCVLVDDGDVIESIPSGGDDVAG